MNDHSSGPNGPDLELLWVPQAVFGDGFPKPNPGTDGVTFAAVALKPESRGRIMLRSNSVWDEPIIDPKCVRIDTIFYFPVLTQTNICSYLSTESDLNVLVRGVRLLLRLARTHPVASKLYFKSNSINPSSPWWPGVADPNLVSTQSCVRLTAYNGVLDATTVPHRSQTAKSRRCCVARPSRLGIRCVLFPPFSLSFIGASPIFL